MRAPRVILLAAMLMAPLACESATGPEAHRHMWNRVRPASYDFEFLRSCFCIASDVWWKLEVRNGAISSFALVDPADASRLGGYQPTLDDFPTIDDLFDELEEMFHTPGSIVTADYDDVWHFPEDVYADVFPSMADDEMGIRVRRFTARGAPDS